MFADADRAVMVYNSPLDYVRTMRRRSSATRCGCFLYGGRDDPDTAQIPAMARALKREGAHASWAIYPGGHSWKTWTPHVDQMLMMASRDFSRPLGELPAACEPHAAPAGPLRRAGRHRV